jgi:exopolysaccharide biosynthesis WecB/TagA/CpsF family protein
VGIGVGASLRFLAGLEPRAPRWMQRAGLEWAFRLLQDPARLWKRYLVDDMRFFPLVWRWKHKPPR